MRRAQIRSWNSNLFFIRTFHVIVQFENHFVCVKLFTLRSSFCRRIVTHSTYLRNALMALNCATQQRVAPHTCDKNYHFSSHIFRWKTAKKSKVVSASSWAWKHEEFHSIVDFVVVFIQCLNRNNITCRMRSSSSKHSLFSRMIRYTWMNVVMMRRRFLLILQFDQIHSTSNTSTAIQHIWNVCAARGWIHPTYTSSSLRFVCVSFSCGSRVDEGEKSGIRFSFRQSACEWRDGRRKLARSKNSLSVTRECEFNTFRMQQRE